MYFVKKTVILVIKGQKKIEKEGHNKKFVLQFFLYTINEVWRRNSVKTVCTRKPNVKFKLYYVHAALQ